MMSLVHFCYLSSFGSFDSTRLSGDDVTLVYRALSISLIYSTLGFGDIMFLNPRLEYQHSSPMWFVTMLPMFRHSCNADRSRKQKALRAEDILAKCVI